MSNALRGLVSFHATRVSPFDGSSTRTACLSTLAQAGRKTERCMQQPQLLWTDADLESLSSYFDSSVASHNAFSFLREIELPDSLASYLQCAASRHGENPKPSDVTVNYVKWCIDPSSESDVMPDPGKTWCRCPPMRADCSRRSSTQRPMRVSSDRREISWPKK